MKRKEPDPKKIECIETSKSDCPYVNCTSEPSKLKKFRNTTVLAVNNRWCLKV